MKKRIIIAAAFTACLALCAAVSPKIEMVEKAPRPDSTPVVTAPQSMLLVLEEWSMTLTTEKEPVEATELEPAPEAIIESPTALSLEPPAAESQTKPELEPPVQPEPEQKPESEQECTNINSGTVVYVPGFGWVKNQGSNQVEYAEDMYETGNKIGSMG